LPEGFAAAAPLAAAAPEAAGFTLAELDAAELDAAGLALAAAEAAVLAAGLGALAAALVGGELAGAAPPPQAARTARPSMAETKVAFLIMSIILL